MKYIILFLLLIITVAIFKKPANHNEMFISAVKESMQINNKLENFSNSTSQLIEGLLGTYKQKEHFIEHLAVDRSVEESPISGNQANTQGADAAGGGGTTTGGTTTAPEAGTGSGTSTTNPSSSADLYASKSHNHMGDLNTQHSGGTSGTGTSGTGTSGTGTGTGTSGTETHAQANTREHAASLQLQQQLANQQKNLINSNLAEQNKLLQDKRESENKEFRDQQKKILDILSTHRAAQLNALEEEKKKIRRKRNVDDKYILKSAITACPPPPDMSQYVLKSSIAPQTKVNYKDYIHKSTLNDELTESEVKRLVDKYVSQNGGGYMDKNTVSELIKKYSNNLDELFRQMDITPPSTTLMAPYNTTTPPSTTLMAPYNTTTTPTGIFSGTSSTAAAATGAAPTGIFSGTSSTAAAASGAAPPVVPPASGTAPSTVFADLDANTDNVNVTSALGTGAKVTVSIVGTSPKEYVLSVTNVGSDYAMGDIMIIKGSVLGGVNGTNDATITTNKVGEFSGLIVGTPP
mgnify:CR=1 FL=1